MKKANKIMAAFFAVALFAMISDSSPAFAQDDSMGGEDKMLAGIAVNPESRGRSQMVLVSAMAFQESEVYDKDAWMDAALSADAFNTAVAPDTKVAPGFTMGADCQYPVLIGNVPGAIRARNRTVSSFVQGGDADTQLTYIRRQDTTEVITAAGVQTIHRDSNIYKLKYSPGDIGLPWGGRIGMGASVYTERGISFAQPFAQASITRAAATIAVGGTRTTGDAVHRTGALASASYVLSPRSIAFVSYSGNDFQKEILNNVILPRAGVDCGDCTRDALSAGATLRFGQQNGVALSLGVYDITDLKIAFGGLSLNRRF